MPVFFSILLKLEIYVDRTEAKRSTVKCIHPKPGRWRVVLGTVIDARVVYVCKEPPEVCWANGFLCIYL